MSPTVIIAMKSFPLSLSLFSAISSIYSLSIQPAFSAIANQFKMCDSPRFIINPFAPSSYLGCRHRRRPIRVHSLLRRMRFAKEEEKTPGVMEIKNLKLYMENQTIIEENERLRKKAFLLHKENQVLLSQLQSFSSNQKSQQPPI